MRTSYFDDAVQEMEPVSTQEQDQGESRTGNLIGDMMGRGMSVLDSEVFESPSNAAVLNPETSSFRKQKDQEFAISLKHIMWANSRGEPLRQDGYRSDPQEVSHPMDGKTVPPASGVFPLLPSKHVSGNREKDLILARRALRSIADQDGQPETDGLSGTRTIIPRDSQPTRQGNRPRSKEKGGETARGECGEGMRRGREWCRPREPTESCIPFSKNGPESFLGGRQKTT